MTRKTALLIIDAQTGIIEGLPEGPVHNAAELLQTMQTILLQARQQSIPVWYVQDLDVAEVGDEAFATHPAIAPLPDEPIIFKRATDSFHGTDLHEQLQAAGIQHLVIMGCQTPYCIDSACRKATTLGYDVTLVKDGHSTTDNDVLSAEQIIAHHNKILHGMGNLEPFILVRHSEENLFEPAHDSYR